MIFNVTWINQNSTIPSAILSDHAAREIISREIQSKVEKEKDINIHPIKPIEKIEKARKESNHIDLKA